MGTIIGIISAVAWGFAFVVLKKLSGYFSPYEIAFYRYLIAGVAFYAYILFKKGRLMPLKEDWLNIAISSVLGIAGVSIFLTLSLRWIDTSITGMLNGTIPLITLLFHRFWFKNKLSNKMIGALLLSLSGIVFLSIPLGMGQFIGYAVVMVGLVLWVIYTFMTASLSKNYTEIELIGYQTIFASIILLPVVLLMNGFESFTKFSDPIALVNMLILGVCVTATAYLCYIIGSNKIGVSKMSFMMNLIPVVSLIAGFVMYDEPISLQKIVGLSLILISIIMITDRKNKVSQSDENQMTDIKIEA